jgi:hypothetical protein
VTLVRFGVVAHEGFVANSIVGDVATGTPNAIVQRIRGRRRTG